jgi:hypothetical protein
LLSEILRAKTELTSARSPPGNCATTCCGPSGAGRRLAALVVLRVNGYAAVEFVLWTHSQGLTLTRILAMTADAVHVSGQRVTIRLGSEPLEVPQPLGQLVALLASGPARRNCR